MFTRRSRIVLAVAAVAALGAGGAAIAVAGGDDDDATETPITGSALDRASQVALDEVDGKVTATEVDDEQGKYEIEVTRSDGSQVDVHLDGGFKVIDTEDEGADDGGADDN